MFQHAQVKEEMKKKGWSYRSASVAINRSYQWICLVLNGKATSRPVLQAIRALPVRDASKKNFPAPGSRRRGQKLIFK